MSCDYLFPISRIVDVYMAILLTSLTATYTVHPYRTINMDVNI